MTDGHVDSRLPSSAIRCLDLLRRFSQWTSSSSSSDGLFCPSPCPSTAVRPPLTTVYSILLISTRFYCTRLHLRREGSKSPKKLMQLPNRGINKHSTRRRMIVPYPYLHAMNAFAKKKMREKQSAIDFSLVLVHALLLFSCCFLTPLACLFLGLQILSAPPPPPAPPSPPPTMPLLCSANAFPAHENLL